MIFRIRSPKGTFGQNMSTLPNGSLTSVSRSYQSAVLKRPFKKNKPKTVTTTVAERQDTERHTFKELQHTAFKNEITSLSQKEQNAKISRQSSLLKLDPFVDEQGLIRVGARLENSTLPFEVKHPIVLPGSSQNTNLIIDHFHKKVKHQGKGMTMKKIHSNG